MIWQSTHERWKRSTRFAPRNRSESLHEADQTELAPLTQSMSEICPFEQPSTGVRIEM